METSASIYISTSLLRQNYQYIKFDENEYRFLRGLTFPLKQNVFGVKAAPGCCHARFIGCCLEYIALNIPTGISCRCRSSSRRRTELVSRDFRYLISYSKVPKKMLRRGYATRLGTVGTVQRTGGYRVTIPALRYPVALLRLIPMRTIYYTPDGKVSNPPLTGIPATAPLGIRLFLIDLCLINIYILINYPDE